MSMSVDALTDAAEAECFDVVIGALIDLPADDRDRVVTTARTKLGLDRTPKRRPRSFKRDVMCAIHSARDAGLPVAGVEITCKDGTRIRLLGPDAASTGNELDEWLKKECASGLGV
jgi:hypothetical protein